MNSNPRPRRRGFLIFLLVLALGGAIAWFGWYKFFRQVEPPPIASDEEWFKHGSLGGESRFGIPYWIWVALPRIFPDLLPGSGGYKSFGVVWEPGSELPVGFTKKTVGFPRVGNNCALCHVATYRLKEDENPVVVVGAPAHSFNVQAMFRFFSRAANDPRFNANTLLSEINQNYDLGLCDRLLYRFAIIPFTRKAFIQQGQQLAWMDRPGKPDWGPGRDDAFNLAKYFLAHGPEDHSVGQCDFASAWNLQVRKGTNLFLNWGGESPSIYTVLVDSSVGVGARPSRDFEPTMKRLDGFLSRLQPPRWPYPEGPYAIKTDLAANGKALYQQHCASCHEPGQPRCNRPIPIDEIGTNRERFDSWTPDAARKTNQAINDGMGAHRPDTIKNIGYLASPLDGLWLRAPYLHNGSVPNLRALLQPPEQRPPTFYRGGDLYDPGNVGFVSSGPAAERGGFLLDTHLRGNGNQGHTYGAALTVTNKEALLEYLKTL